MYLGLGGHAPPLGSLCSSLHLILATQVEKFMSQPFAVAEIFTGLPGKLVDLKDTIHGFKQILAGDYDDLPEGAFYMVGGIDEVVVKAQKMAAELEA